MWRSCQRIQWESHLERNQERANDDYNDTRRNRDSHYRAVRVRVAHALVSRRRAHRAGRRRRGRAQRGRRHGG
jgi:hypothetical protein